VEDPPSDDGDQNDKQRSNFWWFMEAGEWGGMISEFYPDCRLTGASPVARSGMKPSPVPDGLPPPASRPRDWPDAKAPIAVIVPCQKRGVEDRGGLTARDLAASCGACVGVLVPGEPRLAPAIEGGFSFGEILRKVQLPLDSLLGCESGVDVQPPGREEFLYRSQ
jgi:hypothetical protein